ncbi:glycosyltransferase family 4 protein [Allochromatium tepidum]|nr:glycosyltransferase family 4 protein [Allochromatium tepidum]
MPGPVLLLTRNFPPLWGGMERLNHRLAGELAQHTAVRVIAPGGAAAHAPPGVTVREVAGHPLARFLMAAFAAALQEARAGAYDWVLAGSGLTAPMALAAAKAANAKAAAYVHGLDLAVRHPLYRALWLPAIRRLDRVIVNSRATADLAQEVGVAAERIAIVHPGVELPTATPEERARLRASFREQHGLGERPVLLTVGRLTTRKGVAPFVAEVLPQIVRVQPDVCLLVVGDVPRGALAATAEPPATILRAAEQANVGNYVRWLGPRFGSDLSAAFFAADVHVFPVRDLPGDPEGFGMVAVEAASHGLPTVAYATGGVVDAVADGLSGRLVAPGDATGFAQAVLDMLSNPPREEALTAYAARFAWPHFGAAVWQALQG